MMEINSFYLSRILGKSLLSKDKKVIGKIKDLGIVNEIKNPKVEAIKVKTAEGIKIISWDNIMIIKEKGQYALIGDKLKEKDRENIMFLSQHVLDKQIIDVNGRKVVRVNDVMLSTKENGLFVVAVDIGIEGLLRRLGIAKPLVNIGVNLSSKLLLWNTVETIFKSNENIQLSQKYNKLSILHPSDLADIIEDFDKNTGMIIFSSLDNAKAADVLEEMEEDAQIGIIKNLSTDKAADILEEMPADEVADILDGLSENKAEELLNNMEKEASDEVRELMEYEEHEVGSLMSTEIISFTEDITVETAISHLRQIKPEEDEMYYIYVVDNENKLLGILSLRDLIISFPEVDLGSIMYKEFSYLYDNDDIQKLAKMVSKYNLLAVPIVNKEREFLGNVIINDIIYELLKKKKKIV